jgi:hypothetical protein
MNYAILLVQHIMSLNFRIYKCRKLAYRAFSQLAFII